MLANQGKWLRQRVAFAVGTRCSGGVLLIALLGACSGPVQARGAGFSMPVSFAEGHNEQAQAASAGAANAPKGAAPKKVKKDHGGPPDPPPLVTAHYLRYRIRYSKRVPSIVDVQALELKQPAAAERRLGRFAIELWIGKELVERVRFDFPLLVEDPSADNEAPFEQGATVEQSVLLPRSDRATRALLVERSGRSWALPWPPERLPSGPQDLTELR